MHTEARVVVTAYLLADGTQVYLRPNDTWTPKVQEAAILRWAEGEQVLADRACDDQPLVFALEVMEAELCDGVIAVYGLTCG